MQYSEEDQTWINSMAAQHADAQGATSYYLQAKGEATGKALDFQAQFNPRLPLHSSYFKKLDAVMSCVEAHVASGAKDDARVCHQEMKDLRLSAFKDELLYQQVNKRHFMNELMSKNNQSPW